MDPVLNENDEKRDAIEDDDDHSNEVGEDVEDAQEGSEGFVEDSPSCADCPARRAELLNAFDAANEKAKLKAQVNDVKANCEKLSELRQITVNNIEKYTNLKNKAEALLTTCQIDVDRAKQEIASLTARNEEMEENLGDIAGDLKGMEERAKKCQKIIAEKTAHLEKRKQDLSKIRTIINANQERLDRAINEKNEMDERIRRTTKQNVLMKSKLAGPLDFIANLAEVRDLPDFIRRQVNAFLLDDTLAVVKRDGSEIDEPTAEAIDRVLVSRGPRFSRGRGGGGPGSRGGRGGYISRRKSAEAGREVVDESMHEDVLARKLHRDDAAPDDPAAAAVPVAKSVMGRKTETVREVQERQKAGRKEKIAGLKKEQEKSKQAGAKAAAREPPAMSLKDQLMMSDDDDEEKSDAAAAAAARPKLQQRGDEDHGMMELADSENVANATARDGREVSPTRAALIDPFFNDDNDSEEGGEKAAAPAAAVAAMEVAAAAPAAARPLSLKEILAGVKMEEEEEEPVISPESPPPLRRSTRVRRPSTPAVTPSVTPSRASGRKKGGGKAAAEKKSEPRVAKKRRVSSPSRDAGDVPTADGVNDEAEADSSMPRLKPEEVVQPPSAPADIQDLLFSV